MKQNKLKSPYKGLPLSKTFKKKKKTKADSIKAVIMLDAAEKQKKVKRVGLEGMRGRLVAYAPGRIRMVGTGGGYKYK